MNSLPTFGVEFEFALAANTNPNAPNPDPEEKRKVRFDFDRTPADPYANDNGVLRDVRETLRTAGFPVANVGDQYDVKVWTVKPDISIGDADYEWTWYKVEVTTPAYYYTQEALDNIKYLCKLITSTYRVSTSPETATGLHVHVGYGRTNFTLDHIRKFCAFTWAFSPQFNSLHYRDRLNLDLHGSPRQFTQWAVNFFADNGRQPTGAEGAAFYLGETDYDEFARNVGGSSARKFTAYNIEQTGTEDSLTKTIEFRQHRGTLDGEAVVQWVQTVVGLVRYLENIHPEAFSSLLSVVTHETWNHDLRIADPTWGIYPNDDLATERQIGPIVADGRFTIIDLLKHMKLWGPARYYLERGFYKHSDPDAKLERGMSSGPDDGNDDPWPSGGGGGGSDGEEEQEEGDDEIPPRKNAIAPKNTPQNSQKDNGSLASGM